jgi:hypothetical protein
MTSNSLNELPFANLNENSFQTYIYELDHGLINYDFDKLTLLSYNPFACTINQNLALSPELDPDANLYLPDIGHSRYYVEDEFNSMITKETQRISIFSIFHLNIRSLIQNLSHLTDFLNNIDIQFSIIGIVVGSIPIVVRHIFQACLVQALKYRSVTDIVRPIRKIVRRKEEITGHSVRPK